MNGINIGRVVGGGLVAGLVANIIDFATNYLLMADFVANAERLHLDTSGMNSAAGIAPWVIVDFIVGIMLVFTYAAIRPRFGRGAGTAVIAGLTLYITVTAVLYGFSSMGIMTMGLFVKSSACALVSVLVASIAGAAVYKE